MKTKTKMTAGMKSDMKANAKAGAKADMKADMDRKALGAAIKAARLENKLTQEKLAELIGITPSFVKQIEAGSRSPSIEVLYKFTHTLNLSVDDIFFPGRPADKKLLYQIERSLQDCSVQELRMVYSTIAALKDMKEED